MKGFFTCCRQDRRSWPYLQSRYIRFDLQLFAGEEKTEPATPHRRQEARRKGQVFHSQELNAGLVLMVTGLTVFILLPHWGRRLIALTQKALYLVPIGDWEIATVSSLNLSLISTFALMMLPLFAAAFGTALVSNILQVGFVFSLDPIQFQLSRLDPVNGLQRIFSRRSVVTLLRSVLKLVVITWVAVLTVRSEYELFQRLPLMGLSEFLEGLKSISFKLLWRSALTVLGLAFLDYLYQRWEHEQGLKMSRQELKEEFKQTEGSPEIKARVRERQRQLARSRMMHRVPEADVVITNPTHYAVALKYDALSMDAPEVVAKGAGRIAERIKELARFHGVSVVEDKPLAQALYRAVDVGESIPAAFYQAVAEVLAYVYQQKGLV
ncbi:MAG: flagellar biosynthesis protein FlhB [bacterium]